MAHLVCLPTSILGLQQSQTWSCFEAVVYVPDCMGYEVMGRRETGKQANVRDL